MHRPIGRSQQLFASALAASLLLPSCPPAASATIIAAGSFAKTAPAPGAQAGARIARVSVQPGLGGLAGTNGISLRTVLPGRLTPALALNDAGGYLRTVAAGAGTVAISARIEGERAVIEASGAGVEAVGAKTPLELPSPSAHGSRQEAESAEAALDSRPENARKPVGRLLARIGSALRVGRGAQLFDGPRGLRGLGILPDSSGPEDIALDPRPSQPGNTELPRLSWNRVHLPGADGLPERADGSVGAASVRPVELPGNPSDADGVESALRRLIRENPAQFGAISVEQLETVVKNKAAGREGLLDTIYVNFRQRHAGVSVDGTYLDFTVKLIRGRAVLVSSTAQLFPTLALDVNGRYAPDEILEKAFERLGRPTGSFDDMKPLGRRVLHIGGRWRVVDILVSESRAFKAAVDINSGEAFAWDARHTAAAGTVTGRGVEFDPAATGENLVEMPLANTEIKSSDGTVLYTDSEGNFTWNGDAPATLTARLKGKYATIQDQGRKELVVTVQAQPGQRLRLVFNPAGFDENTVAQVNAYRHANRVHDWIVSRGIDAAGLHISLPIKTNMNQDCNAYYTPWSPSLNFFFSSARCINTAYDTVVYHEYGHFVDDVIGGIVNGALSEGWGDILGMYITGQPILGEGFLKGRTPNYIRHGENKYQFNARDEVHKQGEAWMGFAWKLRQNLIASLGAAKGAALAESLVIPVLYANARDIPAAIAAVLLRDVGEDGRAAHFSEIAAAAQAHGIALKEPRPGEISASVASLPAAPALQAAGAESQGRGFSLSRWIAGVAKALADFGNG